MNDFALPGRCPARPLLGFVAGFLATLVFHQLTLGLLWGLGMAPFAPFQMTATQPFGVPAVLSLAFWGGVWGIAYALVDRRFFPQGNAYWATAFSVGAILPSLVALLVVLPLKGKALGGGWQPALLVTVLLVNGAWGVGTGLFLRWLSARCGRVG
jgi:hypothetical protein